MPKNVREKSGSYTFFLLCDYVRYLSLFSGQTVTEFDVLMEWKFLLFSNTEPESRIRSKKKEIRVFGLIIKSVICFTFYRNLILPYLGSKTFKDTLTNLSTLSLCNLPRFREYPSKHPIPWSLRKWSRKLFNFDLPSGFGNPFCVNLRPTFFLPLPNSKNSSEASL